MNLGRDKRRGLSLAERRELYDEADGRCQHCGEELPPAWHAAHLTAWSNGGATSLDNMEAWCAPCNLRFGDENVERPRRDLKLREWQKKELPGVLTRLHDTGEATVHAVPGAGKTIFVGEVFRRLYQAGLVHRIVVVVPNRVIREQWTNVLGNEFGIHVDPLPQMGWIEHPSTVGLVTTYQGCLSNSDYHRKALLEASTLVVFDEVHHLAEQRSWGRTAKRMVHRDDGRLAACILNTTGTLFRTSKTEVIPTVRYEPHRDSERKLVAIADVSVPPLDLIGRELRPLDVHACGSSVELIDLASGETSSGEIADVGWDDDQRRAAHAQMVTDPGWMRGMAEHMVRKLAHQKAVIEDREPLKALWVAKDIHAAKLAAQIINEVADADFARLVTSDDDAATKRLRSAVRGRGSLCIVAVQMVTEGFDCPQVSTIAYASNRTAELFVIQMVARAMRMTDAERDLGRVLPAHVLIPDVPDLRKVFTKVANADLHMVEYEERERERAAGGDRGPFLPRFDLASVTAPRLEDVVIADKDVSVTRSQVDLMEAMLTNANMGPGIANTFAPRFVLTAEEYQRADVLPKRVRGDVTTKLANPRDVNLALRGQITTRAHWWAARGDTSAQEFQAWANQAAGVGIGGRDLATAEQLQNMLKLMSHRIDAHCEREEIRKPSFLTEGDQ